MERQRRLSVPSSSLSSITSHPQTPPVHPDIFDLLLTRDLSRAHIVDFNPYSPRSDSLLFSFEELRELAQASRVNGTTTSNAIPEFRYIDSAAHPAASRNAPVHQHNMVPFEALQLSSGQDIEGFAEMWKNEVLGASRA